MPDLNQWIHWISESKSAEIISLTIHSKNWTYSYFILKHVQVHLSAIFLNPSTVLQLKHYFKSFHAFSLFHDNLFPPQLH